MSDPITRSGSNYSLPRDSNRVPAVGGVLASDGKTINPLEIDGSGNLLVNVAAGSAETQYTDGSSTVIHPIGTMPVYDNAGTISKVGTSNGLPVQGNVGSASNAINVGQKTTNTTAVQLSASSVVPTNGIIVEALSSNSSESIFIGDSGVTTSNGYELQTGASIAFTCNLNTLYIVSATSTTNKVCWNVV